jgi:hypothetical protein
MVSRHHIVASRTNRSGSSPRTNRMLFLVVAFLCAPLTTAAAPMDSLIVFTSSELPIVVIDTHGQEIRNEPKITADMGVIDNGPGVRNRVTDPRNAYSGKIGIEIRGSSSTQFPKKQYAVETRDAAGADLDVSLLGMPAESDWVLFAPYNDKTLIRDALVYTLARRMGRYASRVRFCELVLNGQYEGVYVLFEKIKRDKNRVNITKEEVPDTTGDALTGGYIIKIDKNDGAGNEGWYSGFLPFVGAAYRVMYQYHYPKPEDIVWPQRGYITRYIRDFELAMYLPSFNDPVNGYPRWLDVGAFIDYILVNEIGKNVDAYRLSTYMYKDRDAKGGKLVMGPPWDYNLAFGNCNYHRTAATDGFHLTYMSDSAGFRKSEPFLGPFWWKKIFDDPPVRQQMAARWSTLRAGELSTARVFGLIDSMASVLTEARQRNFLRWSVLGTYIWPNVYVGPTYEDEIQYLKNWITARFAWMDKELAVTGMANVGVEGLPATATLGENYPNPFNPGTTIPVIVREASRVQIVIYDVLGREVARLVDADLAPGQHPVVFDGSGLASGVYLCRLSATFPGAGTREISVQYRRMLLLR